MHNKLKRIVSGCSGVLLASALTVSGCPVFANPVSNDLTNTSQVQNVKSKIEDQVVVVYKNAAKDNIQNTDLKQSDVSGATSLSKSVDVLTPAEGDSATELKDKIEQDSNNQVQAVFTNAKAKLTSLPNDVSGGASGSQSSGAYQAVEADKTWNQVPSGSQKVKVAVIDGDITTVPDDLSGRMEKPVSIASSSTDKTVSTDHGTEVCSLIAATADNNKGIAGFSGKYDVDIAPYSLATFEGDYVDIASVASALKQITADKDIKIINLSLALTKDAFNSEAEYTTVKSAMTTIVKQLNANGISVVAAGGNADKAADEVIPADIDGVISVGSTDNSGKASSFNQDANPDIYAPGENLSVLKKDGSVTTGSGTSFSAPIVTANLAQLYSQKLPNGKFATLSQAEDALMKTSVEKVKDKRFASFSTTKEWLDAKNPGTVTTKKTTINYDLPTDAINKAIQDAGLTGTVKWALSLKNKTLNVGEKLGELPKVTLTTPTGYTISGTWVDANGKAITEATTAPDADSTTYTFSGIKITKTANSHSVNFSVDTSGVKLPSGVTISLDKLNGMFNGEMPSLPTIVSSAKDYAIQGYWAYKDGSKVDLKNIKDVNELVYKVTKITKKDSQDEDHVTLTVKDDDIREAAGELIGDDEEITYKVDGKTYTGDATISLSVKDGKVDHVPVIEMVSPEGLTLRGVWKNEKGDALMKNSVASGTYTLSDISVIDENSATGDKDSEIVSPEDSEASEEANADNQDEEANADEQDGDEAPQTGVDGSQTGAMAAGALVVAASGLMMATVRRKKNNL